MTIHATPNEFTPLLHRWVVLRHGLASIASLAGRCRREEWMSATAPANAVAPAVLAARVALAVAAVDLCEGRRAALRRLCAAQVHGEVAWDERVRIARETCGEAFDAFLAAWLRGASAAVNMRVIELAVEGRAQMLDPGIRMPAERLMLDFMRRTVRRVPEPSGAGAASNRNASGSQDCRSSAPPAPPLARAEDGLEEALDALLAAMQGDAPTAALAAAHDAVAAAAQAIVHAGGDPLRLQLELDWWSRATGGPEFRLAPAAPSSAS